MMRACACLLISFLFLVSCTPNPPTLFTRLDEGETGVTFRNLLKEENPDFNILHYPYFYNGGGVAVGDINNDGLQDIFFTGNMVKNRLFLNKGDFSFDDITVASRVAEKEGWCTGAAMADVNADGWLDIYVCRSALPNERLRRNLLFINNRNLTFTESASAYGLDDPGYATQASFFDYDADGDLDMFLINQSAPEFARGNIDYLQHRLQPTDSLLENKLFRNDGGKFVNVTRASGITSNVFTFSLGVSTADINQDGWPDIYVSNDFKEADHLYINNGNGTFTERGRHAMDHHSLYAMGVDIADYNNDALPDVLVADMLAEGNEAQKMHMGGDNYTQYRHLFRNGMFFQYMQNTLQKNNGDGTFSEIAYLAGVSNTDWSWSPLWGDYDNDGRKDLFITNGYKRDNTDMQFITYSMNQSLRQQQGGRLNVAEYISHMPGISLPNYAFRNTGNDSFANSIQAWGFDHNTYSHGAAYADLDNDGDLDMVTNNTDDFAGVYRNNSEALAPRNFLTVVLKGHPKNPSGIGAKVYAYAGPDRYYVEQVPVRGYQSSVDHRLHLGLGSHKGIDSLRIVWPDQTTQVMRAVAVNTMLVVAQADAGTVGRRAQEAPKFLHDEGTFPFTHRENDVNDFTRQFLLPHFLSRNGPCLAAADVNGDGLEDVYAGGAGGQAGVVLVQQRDGSFKPLANPAFERDAGAEDVDAAFFDADGDGDADLYVVSGGYEFERNNDALTDRLYRNNGHGVFARAPLPAAAFNDRCVAAEDIDADGDIDLFVGGDVVPGQYPLAEPSRILVNDGNGTFADQSEKYLTPLAPLQLVHDAVWIDVDRNGTSDLVTVGQWNTIRVFINHNGLTEQSAAWIPFPSDGWWNTVLGDDVDRDGDIDLVVGNAGLNSPVKADAAHPTLLYAADIDNNGSVDPIQTHYFGGASFPLVPRDDLIGQVPSLKKKFNDYGSYAKATVTDLIHADLYNAMVPRRAGEMRTLYLENKGDHFEPRSLPVEAQYAPVHAVAAVDANADGHTDLVLAGNNGYGRIYMGRHDASHGVLLLGDGHGGFRYTGQATSGLALRGDVRSAVRVGARLLFGINNAAVRVYRLNTDK